MNFFNNQEICNLIFDFFLDIPSDRSCSVLRIVGVLIDEVESFLVVIHADSDRS